MRLPVRPPAGSGSGSGRPRFERSLSLPMLPPRQPSSTTWRSFHASTLAPSSPQRPVITALAPQNTLITAQTQPWLRCLPPARAKLSHCGTIEIDLWEESDVFCVEHLLEDAADLFESDLFASDFLLFVVLAGGCLHGDVGELAGKEDRSL